MGIGLQGFWWVWNRTSRGSRGRVVGEQEQKGAGAAWDKANPGIIFPLQ